MSTSNELRVFISSTFRDLQDEREYLMKNISCTTKRVIDLHAPNITYPI